MLQDIDSLERSRGRKAIKTHKKGARGSSGVRKWCVHFAQAPVQKSSIWQLIIFFIIGSPRSGSVPGDVEKSSDMLVRRLRRPVSSVGDTAAAGFGGRQTSATVRGDMP